MSKKEAISRYSLIIKRLRRKPCNFQELKKYLQFESELQDYNFDISIRTFQRDINDILTIYSIEIGFDPNARVYYIKDDGEKNDINFRRLEAFDLYHALSVSDGLSGIIHLDHRQPKGTEHLYGIIHAIKNGLVIQFTYKKFEDDSSKTRIINPYALKEFKQRWYLIGYEKANNHVKTFALDRLFDFEITLEKFKKPNDFKVDSLFEFSFGIMNPFEPHPENIVLSFEPEQGKYIKSLPLHPSQKIIEDNDKELRITLKLCATYDLFMEIMSFGDGVKVIKPKSFAKQIKEAHQKAMKLYDDQ